MLLILGIVLLVLVIAAFAAHEVVLARTRRIDRERPATLEGGGSHLSSKR